MFHFCPTQYMTELDGDKWSGDLSYTRSDKAQVMHAISVLCDCVAV